MATVRKKLTDAEKKIVNLYKTKTKQIDGIFERKVHPQYALTFGHLRSVPAGAWLNDDVVNFYIFLLQKKHPDVQMQNSFFFDKMLGLPNRTAFSDGKVICIDAEVTESNDIPAILDKARPKGEKKKMKTKTHDMDQYKYEQVKWWSNKRPFLEKRLFFAPINVNNTHWMACAGKVGNLLVKNAKVSTWTLTY